MQHDAACSIISIVIKAVSIAKLVLLNIFKTLRLLKVRTRNKSSVLKYIAICTKAEIMANKDASNTSLHEKTSNCTSNCTETYYAETDVRVKETVLIWTIKNASTWYMPTGKFCESPSYSFDIDEDPTEWEIRYYPNGCDTSHESWASLELYENIYLQKVINFYVKISITDASNIERVQHETFISLTDTQNIVLTVEKFICKKDIANFIVNGNLKIICRLYRNVEVSNTVATRSNLCELIENNVISHTNDFEKLLDDSKFSDVKLKTDNQEFSAHKAILSARSRVFRAMFEHDMKENLDNVVSIVDIDGEIVKEMLRFIYVGKVNDLERIADKLLIAADKYELNGLKSMCEAAMIKSLSGKTIKDTLILVDRYHAERLRDSAIEFIAMHAKDLSVDENFNASIKNLSPSLLALVIKALMSRA